MEGISLTRRSIWIVTISDTRTHLVESNEQDSHHYFDLGIVVSIGITPNGYRKHNGNRLKHMGIYVDGYAILYVDASDSKPYPISQLTRLCYSQGCNDEPVN